MPQQPRAPDHAQADIAESGPRPETGADTGTGLRPGGPEGDVGFVALTAWDLVLAAGRPGWRFGTRERAHLAALAQLADARWADMTDRDPGMSHPSRAS